jgi:hypothetical protein
MPLIVRRAYHGVNAPLILAEGEMPKAGRSLPSLNRDGLHFCPAVNMRRRLRRCKHRKRKRLAKALSSIYLFVFSQKFYFWSERRKRLQVCRFNQKLQIVVNARNYLYLTDFVAPRFFDEIRRGKMFSRRHFILPGRR